MNKSKYTNMHHKVALIGASGYIAERHMKAIKETGTTLRYICDIHNSCGVVDRYFSQAKYFYDYKDVPFADYVAICTPNDTHFEIAKHFLKKGSNVICEKPVCLTLAQIYELREIEIKTQRKVNCIMQLRYNESMNQIVNDFQANEKGDIAIEYHAYRGDWYDMSWKGDAKRSGGLLFNIGVHIFDFIQRCFKGLEVQSNVLKLTKREATIKFTCLDKSILLNLSTSGESQKRIYVNSANGFKEYNFSEGFENLHTRSYIEIFNGNGIGLLDASKSIALIENIFG